MMQSLELVILCSILEKVFAVRSYSCLTYERYKSFDFIEDKLVNLLVGAINGFLEFQEMS